MSLSLKMNWAGNYSQDRVTGLNLYSLLKLPKINKQINQTKYMKRCFSRPANKHMRRRSTSLVIRLVKIKNKMGYHYIPIRRTKIKKIDYIMCWQGGTAFDGIVRLLWQFLKTLSIPLPYFPPSRS